MELSTNRSVARIVLIVVLCLFTVIGINRSLKKVASDIEAGFYNGVKNADGYTEKSIQSHLDNVADASNGLASVLADSDTEKAFQSSRYALLDAKTYHEKYEALTEITDAVEKLLLSSKIQYTEGTEEAFAYYTNTILQAKRAVESLSYNETVSEYYEKTLKTFPISILRLAVLTDGPQYFN